MVFYNWLWPRSTFIKPAYIESYLSIIVFKLSTISYKIPVRRAYSMVASFSGDAKLVLPVTWESDKFLRPVLLIFLLDYLLCVFIFCMTYSAFYCADILLGLVLSNVSESSSASTFFLNDLKLTFYKSLAVCSFDLRSSSANFLNFEFIIPEVAVFANSSSWFILNVEPRSIVICLSFCFFWRLLSFFYSST